MSTRKDKDAADRESRLLRAPVPDGDFPSGSEAVTGVIRAAGPPAWDGTGWDGTSEPGVADPAGAPTNPLPAPPPGRAGMLPVTGRDWTMTVQTEGPGVPADARLRAARASLDLKVAYLEQSGMGYRIDEAHQARFARGEDLPPGSVIDEALRESVSHLMGPREPYAPAGGWDGWASGLPWYQAAGAS